VSTVSRLEAFLITNPSPVDVEVGGFYQVPCIRHSYADDSPKRGWIPVIGPVHDDADVINFKHRHLHRDTRFTAEGLDYLQGRLTRLTKVERVDDLRWDGTQLEYAMKRRKCRRHADCWHPVSFTKPLEAHHRRCRIGADGLCPHRGIPVALGHRMADGSIVCAGHGLRWSPDGALIPLQEVPA
jgi:hypothetical protein